MVNVLENFSATDVLAEAEKNLQTNTFEAEMRKSKLYSWGLIDDRFIQRGLSDTVQNTLRKLNSPYGNDWNNILIRKKVLSAHDFQDVINGPEFFDTSRLSSLFRPSKRMFTHIKEAIKYGFLNRNTLWSKFLHISGFYNIAIGRDSFDWKHLAKSGLVDIKKLHDENDGFDAVEVSHLQQDLLHRSNKSSSYPLNKKAHPLVQKLRGQENTDKLSQQVTRVIGKKSSRNAMEDFSKVFDYYLKKAPLYKKVRSLSRRKSLKRRERQRKKNIKVVNNHQVDLIEKNNQYTSIPDFEKNKRHFDIYARYEHGKMDPFQLAVISRTAGWYINNGHSRLFNSVRIVPYSTNNESIPLVALEACAGSELLAVTGSGFRKSMVGANRTFLTHSASKESTDMYSIPIIGLMTHKNKNKRSSNKDDYVVFQANFDPKDAHANGKGGGRDVNGDIKNLINETLRTMMEVENREIARATSK